MTFISYAQNFEDVILWRALQGVDKGFYIDVGAWLPDQDSVTLAFYERGWRGINIEPDPASHALLKESRPEDINLQIAVADNAGLLDLYVVPDTGLSTLDPQIAAEHEKNGYPIHIETCPVMTLDLVWDKHVEGRDVHFLKIDVEGFEEKVLRGNDWAKHRPWIVVIEATLPNTQVAAFEPWEPILLDSGYQFVYADGLNRFYLAHEREELSLSFQFPPNYFDQFKTAAQAKAEARAAEVERALETLRAQEQARADALVNELEETRHQLDQSRQRAAVLEHQVLSMHYSKSWRITAPLRAIAARLREVRAIIRQSTRKLLGSAHPQRIFKRLLSSLRDRISANPKLKAIALRFRSRFPRLAAMLEQASSPQYDGPVLAGHAGPPDLSPRAREIYAQLKGAIEQKQKENG